MSTIEIENLTVRYPNRRASGLRDVTFAVEHGETVLLMGPTGSGKSTLARCLNGLIPHHIQAELDGSVRVNGHDTRDLDPGQLSREVGIVFQNPESQFVTLTVADEVAFGLENLGVSPARMDAKIDEALAQVGLTDEKDRRLDRLSGSEKQRLALACALAMDPPTLVLDEPTTHLDPEATARLYRMLDHVPGERTLILIEHKLDACILMVDRVVLLNPEGRLIGNGPPREVFFRYRHAIDDWGVWLPQITEVALRLEPDSGQDVPLRLDEGVEVFKRHLPLRAPTPDEPPGTPPLNAPGARAIVVDKLSHSYPNAERKVLDEVSLTVPAGDFLTLLGPNGSGKSTLGAYIAGLLRAEPGVVTLFGFDPNDLTLAETIERVGLALQNPELGFVSGTVGGEVAYSLRRHTGSSRSGLLNVSSQQGVEELLAQFDLAGLKAADPLTLSQGQQRRLSLAATLATNHRLLVLDEPTCGLDRLATRKLIHLLRGLNHGGVTIILITQDMRVAAAASRNAVLLIDGRLAYHGPTRNLFHQDILLVHAGLWPPPLFDLSLELQRWQPDFPNLMTVDDYLAAFQEQSA